MEDAIPRRVESELVEIVRPFIRNVGEIELVTVRAMCSQELSQRADHGDSTHARLESARAQIRLSLDEADLRKRVETGQRIRTIEDYKTFKPEWGAPLHQIYRVYSGFAAAMSDADITYEPTPRRGLSTRIGRRPGDQPGIKHTFESCLRDLAAMFEHNYGRAFGNDDYDVFVHSRVGMATSDRILRVAQREKGWKGKGTFQRVCDEALRAIATRWSTDYPTTAAYLELLQAAHKRSQD